MQFSKKTKVMFLLAAVLSFLSIGMLSISAAGDTWVDHAKTDWYSTDYTTFTIDSAEKLAGVAKLVNGGNTFQGISLEVSKDLDLSQYDWVPIGTQAKPFKGILRGKTGGVELSGLTISKKYENTGFIGYMDNATVGGFSLKGGFQINTTESINVGAVVGKMNNNSLAYSVTNAVYINVSVNNTSDVKIGGIVGDGSGLLSDVANNGKVAVTGSYSSFAGGIAGTSHGDAGLTLKKIKNTGAVQVTNSVYGAYVGGTIGYVDGKLVMKDEDTVIRNSGSLAVTNGKNIYAGGIAGRVTASATIDFSDQTTNEGNIQISAPTAIGSYAGGLVGSFDNNLKLTINFKHSGTIANNGGASTFTGGIVSYVNGTFEHDQDFTNSKSITASGTTDVYTGGVIGKALGLITFNKKAINTGAIEVSSATDRVYTGGLVGFAGDRLLLKSTSSNAYSNGGQITVNGQNEVYTGGIVSNKAYVKADNNVKSTGDIAVTGNRKLYTGGFVGIVSGSDIAFANEAYGNAITVDAVSTDSSSEVFTGGIVGYHAVNGTIANPVFSGTIAATGGTGAYTGGVAGYASAATITNPAIGNTSAKFADISSDGHVGGVVGYIDGSVTDVVVKYAKIQSGRANAFAGGVAGRAKGTIANVTLADAAYTGDNIVSMLVHSGSTAVGGVVGTEAGPLDIITVTVDKLSITTDAATNGSSLGGVMGISTSNVNLGAGGTMLQVSNVTVVSKGSDSQVGGVVGDNSEEFTPANLPPVKGISITSEGANSNIGGIAGNNKAALTDLSIENVTIVSGGSGSNAGGLAGDSIALLTNNEIKHVLMTSTGASSNIGGIVGRNTTVLANNRTKHIEVDSSGANATVGGIVGTTSANIVNTYVLPEGDSIPQIKTSGADSSIGGIVGVIQNSAITGNTTDVNVLNLLMTTTASASGTKAGGVVGYSNATQVTAIIVEAPIIKVNGANTDVGGIAGYMKDAAITSPKLNASLPDNVIMAVAGADSRAGGIAGRAERVTITGNAPLFNIVNLTLSTTVTASGVQLGGIVGTNTETLIDKVFLQNVSIVHGGANGVVGGMTGYNKGTATALVVQNYIEKLNMTANASAASSTIGGMIGLNDVRDGGVDAAAIESAISSVQNSRIVGNIAVHSPSSVTGVMVGENRTIIANNSIADKIPVASYGDQSILGGYAGKNSGTLYYLYSNAVLTVEGESVIAGGFTGENTGKIIASYTETDLTGEAVGKSGSYAMLGGLVGKNSGTVQNSYNAANVTAKGAYTVVGGLIGEHSGIVTRSYAAKDVAASAVNSFAGGFVGRLTTGTVAEIYSAGHVTASSGASAGGFAGRYDNANKELISNGYYVKDESKGINSGLLDFGAGTYYELNLYARLSPILSTTLADREEFPALSKWTFDDTAWRYGSPNADYKYPELNRNANTGDAGGDDGGNDVNMNIAWYTKNPEAARFVIKSEAELAGLSAIVNGTVIGGGEPFNFRGRLVEVAAPIHIQSNQWKPIGDTTGTAFEGTFEGNNHLISGHNVVAEHYAGLFGVIGSNAIIKNVFLEPLSVTGNEYAGSLAGLNKGVLSQVHVTILNNNKVTGGAYTGGVAGKNTGKLSDLSLTVEGGGKITSAANNAFVGGLAGDNISQVSKSSVTVNSGSIEATGTQATIGGLFGRQEGDTDNLAAAIGSAGSVKAAGAQSVVGGLIGLYVTGKSDGMTVTFTDGKVEAVAPGSVIGGAVGKSESAHTVKNIAVSATNATNGINIQGPEVVGGAIGEKTGKRINEFDIEGAKLQGAVISTKDTGVVGGIAGKLTNATVKNTSFAGVIRATANNVTAGGIAGYSYNSIIYKTAATPDIIVTTTTGESSIGGITGIAEASDIDYPLDFGLFIPLYSGIYEADVQNKEMNVTSSGNQVDVYVGTITGQLKSASIYNSATAADISVTGLKTATVGGVAGASNGIIINTKAQSGIKADGSTVYHVGGFVGQSTGGKMVFDRVASEGSKQIAIGRGVTAGGITASTHIGGFVGIADATAIQQSSASIPVAINCIDPYNTIYAGGFAGLLGNSATGTIQEAYADGAVTVKGKAGAYAGGFAGMVNLYTIKEAYASGQVTAEAFDARGGGFAAVINKDSVIEDAYAVPQTVAVTGVNHATRSYAGGFAAYNNGGLKRVYASVPNVSSVANGSNSYMGSLIGYNFKDGTLTNSYYTGNLQAIHYDTSSGQTAAQAAFANRNKLAGWDFSTNAHHWSYIDGVNQNRPVLAHIANWQFAPDLSFMLGFAKDESVYEVNTAEQLAGVALINNDLEFYKLFNRTAAAKPIVAKVTLGDDIQLRGNLWTPFIVFTGQFDGANHTISGLTYFADGYDTYGFIAENEGSLADVSFVDAEVIGGTNVGIAAGLNHAGAALNRIKATGTVKGSSNYTGGIAGKNDGVLSQINIDNIAVSGSGYVGGVTGYTSTKLNAIEAGSITIAAAGNYSGGIAGETTGEISNIKVDSIEVTGKQYSGGITGMAAGAITDITINGTTTLSGTGDYVGGIAGSVSGNISVTKAGDITVSSTAGNFVGGIAGRAAGEEISVQDSGVIHVSAAEHVGGIAGYTDSKITEVRAGSIEIMASGSFVGGIAGETTGDISNITTGSIAATGKQYAAGVAGKATNISTVTTASISVTGESTLGGIAGAAEGTLTDIVVNGATTINGTGDTVGGVAGEAAGASNLTLQDVTVKAVNRVGGVAGASTGAISQVKAGNVAVEGSSKAAGIAGETAAAIGQVEVASMNVKGTDNVGGVAGKSTAGIADIKITETVEIRAVGEYVGGIAGEAAGDITRVMIGQADVTGGKYTAGIAGKAAKLSDINVNSIKVVAAEIAGGLAGETSGAANATIGTIALNGTIQLGGIAGISSGTISGITVTDVVAVTGTGNEIGGIAGTVAGNVEILKTVEMTVSSPTGNYVGGIAGKSAGAAFTVNDGGTITVTGNDYVGGLNGDNSSNMATASLGKVTVKGNQYVGGAAGQNNADMNGVSINQLELSGNEFVGGIAGRSDGSITSSIVKGTVTANGTVVGGIAGINAGEISTSMTKLKISASNKDLAIAAGGISGSNTSTGTIHESFTYSDLSIESKESNVGGIAGINEGTIASSYFSGTVASEGNVGRAGGIAGYAKSGSIIDSVSSGQINASSDGHLESGKSFFGGIAGQLAIGADLQNNIFDRQMLQRNTAYYDDKDLRVRSAGAAATGLRTRELVNGVLPAGLDAKVWKASQGFYPQLTVFGESTDSLLSAAAVVLIDDDTAYRVRGLYIPTQNSAIQWTTEAIGSETVLTAAMDGGSRSITLNKQAASYLETAKIPGSTSDLQFTNGTTVLLSTAEAGGIIYYTLDSKEPTEDSIRYTTPIPLTATTTISAITVIEGKNDSGLFQATFTKKVSSGGGGGGGGVFTTTPVSGAEILVNGKPADAGKETTSTTGEKTVTRIAVDEQVLQSVLAHEGNNAVVTVKTSAVSDVLIGELNGAMVKNMEDKNAILNVKSDTVAYSIPAAQINMNEIARALGGNVELKDIQVRIEIQKSAAERVQLVENAARAGEFAIVVSPVDFKVTYSHGSISGEVSSFNQYVARTLAIPDGVNPASVTTAVVAEADGTVRHVPTKVEMIDGKYYAVINSLTNSTYTLIRNSVRFADVENHWAKDTVNDMGSRLIVGGVGSGMFEPDREMTRAEFAAIVVKALGVKDAGGQQPFHDVKETDWYSDSVKAAYKYGLIAGNEQGDFAPDEKLTREQAMAIVARATKLTSLEVKLDAMDADRLLGQFNDAGSVADYAKEHIVLSLKMGLVSGKSASMIAPKDNITRAEVTAIIQRLLKQSSLIN